MTVKGVLRDSKQAVKVVFSDPCLKIFVPSALILNLLGAGPMTLILPFCMEKGFSVEQYGYLLSVWTAASLVCVLFLGAVKLSPKVRFWVMALGFSLSVLFFVLTYSSVRYIPMCIFAALAAMANGAGNSVFNAALNLALPEENRGAILGFIQAACTGGCALSALIYGLLGDVFPLYLTFIAGGLLSLVPMLWMCFHPRTREFVLSH